MDPSSNQSRQPVDGRSHQELEQLALKLRREDGAMNALAMRNRANIDPEILAPYMDKWVAWSPDGSRVVAHSEDIQELDSLVAAAGEQPNKCAVEYLDSFSRVRAEENDY